MITTADEFHNHPEFLNRLWNRFMITPVHIYQLNCGAPSKQRDRTNRIVANMYEQFCIDMDNGLI